MVRKIELKGLGRYEVASNQEFVDQHGRLVRVTRESPRNPISVGQAYAFFDCDASITDLENALGEMRSKAETSEGLEIRLYEGSSRPEFGDEFEMALAHPADYRIMTGGRMARGYGAEKRPLGSTRYALIGESGGVDNEKVAMELARISNAFWGMFNQDTEIIRGAVAYIRNGKCVLYE